MLPAYKCVKCGSVFVEWTVDGEHGTAWFFVKRALYERRVRRIEAKLICPECNEDNGTVLWLSGSPLSIFNRGVKAQVLGVINVDDETAVDALKFKEKVAEAYPHEKIVLFSRVADSPAAPED